MVKEWKMYVDGKWVSSLSGETFDVINPATGQVVAKVPKGSGEDAELALKAAAREKEKFAAMSVYERAKLVRKAADEVDKRKEEIAKVLSMEQGKPYEAEALPEVEEAVENLYLAAEDVIRLEGRTIAVRDNNKRLLTFSVARGVYAIITPWNFPVVIPSEFVGPGLAVGNTMVLKPASYTPLSLLLFTECIEKAGFPTGVFNVVTGPGGTVGQALAGSPLTDAIGFVGETVTGKQIGKTAGAKPLLLEMGGNGPLIVLEDANLDAAANAAAFGCYYNAGQVCVATERILVHQKIKEKFLELLLERTKKYVPQDPLAPGANMGPLNNEPTAQKMDLHLKDAVEKGARIIYGGKRLENKPTKLYYQPTIVDNVNEDMLLNKEETFGPVAPLITFSDYDEALRIANGTIYGLQSAVFTSNLKKAFYFAEHLQTGNVVINDSTDYWDINHPFGGGAGKQSGFGRLGGRDAILAMSETKCVAFDISNVID